MVRIKVVLNERRIALLKAHEEEIEAQEAEEAKTTAKVQASKVVEGKQPAKQSKSETKSRVS